MGSSGSRHASSDNQEYSQAIARLSPLEGDHWRRVAEAQDSLQWLRQEYLRVVDENRLLRAELSELQHRGPATASHQYSNAFSPYPSRVNQRNELIGSFRSQPPEILFKACVHVMTNTSTDPVVDAIVKYVLGKIENNAVAELQSKHKPKIARFSIVKLEGGRAGASGLRMLFFRKSSRVDPKHVSSLLQTAQQSPRTVLIVLHYGREENAEHHLEDEMKKLGVVLLNLSFDSALPAEFGHLADIPSNSQAIGELTKSVLAVTSAADGSTRT
eukprot:ANDGO_01354.mRNA.1 hypothetical protein